MLNCNVLLSLYTKVLDDTSFFNNVSKADIKQAIQQMHKAYKGTSDSLDTSFHCLTDFNEVAYRCAYLFKYAPFHTALSYKAMSNALHENSRELQMVLDSLTGPLKLCSLGGGPGADMLGVLAAMHERFGFFRCSAKLVDLMSEWELTFWSVVGELRQQNYGPLSESVSENWFEWSFLTSDLQSKMSSELSRELATADLVTMVKFVSAAASKNTSSMIEKIFNVMKPGAFVLFIDNAAGGFKELISSAAMKHDFVAISKPLKHQPYINEYFNNTRYGYRSCYEVTVAVQLLMKPFPANHPLAINLAANMAYNENIPLSPAPVWQNICRPQFQNFTIGPKPVGNLMNEYETYENGFDSNSQENSFLPPPEFSPEFTRTRPHDFSSNLYSSFESGISLNSSIQASPFPNRSRRGNQSYESMCSPGFNATAHDSGYSDESFGSDLSWNSPMHKSSPHFGAPQRNGWVRIPMEQTVHSLHKNRSFFNTPINNLPPSMEMPPDETFSLSPIPYRQNFQHVEQRPVNFAPPIYPPRSGKRQPLRTLQHSTMYRPKRCHASMPRNKSYQSKRFVGKPSKDVPLSFKSKNSEKFKASRRRTVLLPRLKPY